MRLLKKVEFILKGIVGMYLLISIGPGSSTSGNLHGSSTSGNLPSSSTSGNLQLPDVDDLFLAPISNTYKVAELCFRFCKKKKNLDFFFSPKNHILFHPVSIVSMF